MSPLNVSSSASKSETMSESLRIDGISKQFGGLRVFNELSFVVPPGGVLGIIGPNGEENRP